MKQIYLIVTRHEKRDPTVPPRQHPVDPVDRKADLSQEGLQDAYLLGKNELAGQGIDLVHVATSNFSRTQQTADQILAGAGFDVEKDLRGNQYRARFVTDTRLGLDGTHWRPKGAPPFGNDQLVLDKFVNYLVTNHYLLPEGVPRDNPDKLPIMAARGSAIYEAVANGIDDLTSRLGPQQKAALIVVTHAPIIDAFAVRTTANLQFREKGNDLFDFYLENGPFEAHNQGQFIRGTVGFDGKKWQYDDDKIVDLEIKGKCYDHLGYHFRTQAELLGGMADTGFQVKK